MDWEGRRDWRSWVRSKGWVAIDTLGGSLLLHISIGTLHLLLGQTYCLMG